ncbi:hypothetical protein [Streptomyces sp. NPDC048590]|uniref:hypothetical protein n=1 Tax=Streptomyces sp. NPDC048590 TaxID=3365574 RepID=UPI00371A5F3B
MEPGVADNGPVRLGQCGPHDPGRDRGVLGELAGAIAEDPAGPVRDEVLVEGDPGLGAAAGEVALGERPERLFAELDEADAFGDGAKFATELDRVMSGCSPDSVKVTSVVLVR